MMLKALARGCPAGAPNTVLLYGTTAASVFLHRSTVTSAVIWVPHMSLLRILQRRRPAVVVLWKFNDCGLGVSIVCASSFFQNVWAHREFHLFHQVSEWILGILLSCCD